MTSLSSVSYTRSIKLTNSSPLSPAVSMNRSTSSLALSSLGTGLFYETPGPEAVLSKQGIVNGRDVAVPEGYDGFIPKCLPHISVIHILVICPGGYL